MAHVKPILKKNKKIIDGTLPIYYRLNASKKSRYISTGHRIKPEDWNEEAGIALSTHPHYKELNAMLGKKVHEMNALLIDAQRQTGVRIGIDEAYDIIAGNKSKSFYEFAHAHISRYKNPDTIKDKNSLITVLKQYAPSLSWHQITPNWLKGLEAWTMQRKRVTNRNTVMRYFQFIKLLVKEAQGEGIVSRDFNPLGGLRIRYRYGKKAGLTFEELQKIRGYKAQADSWYQKSRDMFLLMVNLIGMNVGDLLKLRSDELVNGKICHTRNKTINSQEPDYLEIDLTPEASEIISRYYKPGAYYLLPFIRETKDPFKIAKEAANYTTLINKYIKLVAKELGIEKHLTNHTARRTWAQLAERSTGSLKVIQDALGHTNLSTTQGYLGSPDFTRINELNRKVTGKPELSGEFIDDFNNS